MKFLGKWMELENIPSKVNQSQKNTYSISPKAHNTQDTIHRPHKAQEED